jgi:hypothetical protein
LRSASSWIKFKVSRTVRPSRSSVCTTITSPSRAYAMTSRSPGPVRRRAGLPVDVDPIARDPDPLKRVDLPIEVLLHRRHARVPKLHVRTVPQVLGVREKRNAFLEPTYGTAAAQYLPRGVRAAHGRPRSKEMERLLGPTTYVRRRALLSAQTRARQSMALSVVECGCALAGVGECRILIERRSGERVVLPQSSREGDVLRARVAVIIAHSARG